MLPLNSLMLGVILGGIKALPGRLELQCLCEAAPLMLANSACECVNPGLHNILPARSREFNLCVNSVYFLLRGPSDNKSPTDLKGRIPGIPSAVTVLIHLLFSVWVAFCPPLLFHSFFRGELTHKSFISHLLPRHILAKPIMIFL